MRKTLVALFLLLLSPFAGPLAHAAVPSVISYQGQLNNASGVPVTGTISLTFSIYDVATGGTALWSEVQNVPVSNGIFSVNLGAVTSLSSSLFLNTDLYLGVRAGADAEMTPRQKLASGAFAQTAQQLGAQIQGADIAREAVWPEHEGRSNTIVSYHSTWGGGSGWRYTAFAIPADKKLIITDIVYGRYENGTMQCHITSWNGSTDTTITSLRTAWYDSQASRTAVTTSPPTAVSFRAGLVVPAGTTLRIGTTDDNISLGVCTVSGFLIPATP